MAQTSRQIDRVGREFGLEVATVQPGVITEVLRQTGQAGFGARPDEYLVEELIGPAFAKAARTGLERVKVIAGPPVSCEPVDPAEPEGEE